MKLQPEKKSGLYRTWTLYLCDTGAALYQTELKSQLGADHYVGSKYKVSMHKVLGITLCDNLKWGQNTKEFVDKACKRLYLLRVLKQAGVPPDHFITIYCALVWSALEYACQVWSSSVESHLEQQLERVQKRALRIIFPGSDYETALCGGSIPSLSERRLYLCNKTFEKACETSSHLISNVPLGVTLFMGVSWGLATVYRCRDAGRSVLRLTFFRQWPFYNSDALSYSLYNWHSGQVHLLSATGTL